MKTLVIDIETTGLPPKNADYKVDFMKFPHIVGICWKIDEQEAADFIINQEGRAVPKEASDINGITTEIANVSPHKLDLVLMVLLASAAGIDRVVGHNIYFDTSIIKANVLRLIQEGKLKEGTFSDFEALLHKDKRIDTMRKGCKLCGTGMFVKLTVLYQKLFGETFESHTSKGDVEATHRCYTKMLEMGLI